MSFIKTGASAIGKLFIVVALAGAFLVGLVGVVYLSLRGEEIKVPEIIGKDFSESEKELAQTGLKIKKRATRYSQEKPNTVLEQSPKAGETAKTGQMILVVVSQVNPEGTEAPAVVEKETETEADDPATGTNPDRPKKSTTNKNANVKKPAQTTRDGGTKSDKTGNSNTGGTSANTSKSNTSGSPANKGGSTPPSGKPTPIPAFSPKPNPDKTPQSGETRTRRVPN